METPRAGDLPPMPEASLVRDAFGPAALPGDANAALVWQRYLACWEPGGRRPLAKGKEGPLQLFVDAFNARGPRSSHGQALAAAHARLDAAGLPGATLSATTPLIVGLGADHPLEVNLSFDPVLGVPVIPGSGLKGLCRAWSRSEGIPEPDRVRILGPERRPKEAMGEAVDGAGSVSFLDALPVGWPRLRVEIMTPHHTVYNVDLKRWLEAGHTAASPGPNPPIPGDWESPVPVPFLAVERGSRFCFRLAPRGRGPSAVADQQTALTWLRQGLDLFGIGAKTAVGFGAFGG